MAKTHAKGPLDAEVASLGQVVLVFQGGGALGAYQAGVYQALVEAGIEPDWVVGTSIGAINAGLIAGNLPENRLSRLREFWTRMQHSPFAQMAAQIPGWGAVWANAITVASGVRGFFEPNPQAFLGQYLPLHPRSRLHWHDRTGVSDLAPRSGGRAPNARHADGHRRGYLNKLG